MLVACFLSSLFCITVQSQNVLLAPHQNNNYDLIKCVTGILQKYLSEQKELTYVNMNPDDDAILKAVHSAINVSLITRQSTKQMRVPNCAYLVSAVDVPSFTKYFEYLIRESTWNPYARFLIVIELFKPEELTLVFDELLRQHILNVLVVNATDGYLYAYNPFENYACGRYYDNVIKYGLCLEANQNLYPNKLVTGLKNCEFRGSLAHRPPYSLDPKQMDTAKTFLGTEEYIIRLLGEAEQFTISFNYSYNGDLFSTVESNMTAIGPMSRLQKNECDIIFGGMMMVTSRAEAFTYLCGYHDYNDELRFAVKSASLVPTWKYIYLEFDLEVWVLLLVTFIIFFIIAVILLRPKDCGELVLHLLDNLLLHDRVIHTRFVVKCVLMIWVWFAYLINTFYQSSLFSFTTNPIMDFQVSKELDIIKYDLEPCFSYALRDYLLTERNKLIKNSVFRDEGCQTLDDAMITVSSTKDMFTLVPNYYYSYNQRKFNDKLGNSLVYHFRKPYAKFLHGYFFYKGFPITHTLKLNALRMRESGLTDKNLNDIYFSQRLKQRFSEKTFETHFLFPWCICVSGLVLATVTFIIELSLKYFNRIWLQNSGSNYNDA